MQGLLQRIGTTSDATSKALNFRKKPYLGFFLKYSNKRVLRVLGHIFNKVNRGIVQKSDAAGTQNWPGR